MPQLLWVIKTADSKSLSHSDKKEQLQIFSQAQRTSRRQKAATKGGSARKPHSANFGESLARQRAELRNCGSGHCGDDYFDEEWSLPILGHVLQWDSGWTTAERRSAAYFQEVSVYKIITLQRDLNFWKGLVPCLAESHPGIRHLVVAIAATFELLFMPSSHSLNEFALQQCNKALRSLLSERDMDISWLTTSCILVSAFNLLRSDLEAADNSIESGLKMIAQTSVMNPDLEQLSRILNSLGKQHGFKLWTPDITFQFDKTPAGRETLIIETPFLDCPFIHVGQVLATFKTVIVEHVARLIRNLSLGAHIDPTCPLAQDVIKNFSEIFYHWKMFHNSLEADRAEEKLQLVQLKIGLLSAYLLFVAKIIESNEVRVDAYGDDYAEMVRLGQEVIDARHSGRPVVYLDRIVNGALYASAMCCREPSIRRWFICLLKSQVVYGDGLVNYLRGRVTEIIAEIEEGEPLVKSCHDIPESRRIRICGLHCREDRTLCVQYMMTVHTDRLSLNEHTSELDAELDQFNTQEVEDCLKGMTSAFNMYGRVDIHIAPGGYLREMYYGGKLVPICWRADLASRYQFV